MNSSLAAGMALFVSPIFFGLRDDSEPSGFCRKYMTCHTGVIIIWLLGRDFSAKPWNYDASLVLEESKISHENGMQDLDSQECWIILVHDPSGVATSIIQKYSNIYTYICNAVLALCNIGFTMLLLNPFDGYPRSLNRGTLLGLSINYSCNPNQILSNIAVHSN